MNDAMPARVDFDFRHGLAEPAITRDHEGEPIVVLVHGQDRVRIALSEHSLRALGLVILTSVGRDGC
jgi:hypothetical protein